MSLFDRSDGLELDLVPRIRPFEEEFPDRFGALGRAGLRPLARRIVLELRVDDLHPSRLVSPIERIESGEIELDVLPGHQPGASPGGS
jgi:hypothetical protein